jgi:hypothetical protein
VRYLAPHGVEHRIASTPMGRIEREATRAGLSFRGNGANPALLITHGMMPVSHARAFRIPQGGFRAVHVKRAPSTRPWVEIRRTIVHHRLLARE